MPENVISALRRNKKLTQKELAKLCGVTQQHIQMIETGKRLPSLRLAAKLAFALDVPVDELIGEQKAG